MPALKPSALSPATLDRILVCQFAVAWAGEGGEDPRLSWWRSDLTSTYGGEDLFRRLLPATWPWACLQAAREAASRHDARLRQRLHDPDRMISLFHLGVALDLRLDQRLLDLKQEGRPPAEALPGYPAFTSSEWRRESFQDWARSFGEVPTTVVPGGRRLKADPDGPPDKLVGELVAALLPLTPEYPLPHTMWQP